MLFPHFRGVNSCGIAVSFLEICSTPGASETRSYDARRASKKSIQQHVLVTHPVVTDLARKDGCYSRFTWRQSSSRIVNLYAVVSSSP